MGSRATIFPYLTQMKPSLHAQPIFTALMILLMISTVDATTLTVMIMMTTFQMSRRSG